MSFNENVFLFNLIIEKFLTLEGKYWNKSCMDTIIVIGLFYIYFYESQTA